MSVRAQRPDARQPHAEEPGTAPADAEHDDGPAGADGPGTGPDGTARRTAEPPADGAKPADPRATLVRTALLDVGVPLGLYYGLRAVGVGQWLSLLISGALPLVRLLYKLVRERRVAPATAFTLSILLCGTVITLLTGDARLLLARESYLTGLLGLWMIGTLLAERPFIFTTTVKLLPAETAAEWQKNWAEQPRFRSVMRWMTVAWAAVFLIDSAARVVMAYTMPVDSVPVVSAVLLVGMLVIVAQGSKAYGRRMMAKG